MKVARGRATAVSFVCITNWPLHSRLGRLASVAHDDRQPYTMCVADVAVNVAYRGTTSQ